GNAAEADRPSPALSESPSTTILIGLASAAWLSANPIAAAIRPAPNTSICMNIRADLSTAAAEVPYDRAMDSLIEPSSLAGLDEDALARFRGRQVGIVFQSFHLIPTMTALENVAVPLELAGNPDAAQRAAEELFSVGLGDRLHHYPTQLSGGEQQRVALARALAPDPAILVADEPTGNLDEATGKQIVDLLFAKHDERGMTLVLVTHDTSLAQRCDRVVRLRW